MHRFCKADQHDSVCHTEARMSMYWTFKRLRVLFVPFTFRRRQPLSPTTTHFSSNQYQRLGSVHPAARRCMASFLGNTHKCELYAPTAHRALTSTATITSAVQYLPGRYRGDNTIATLGGYAKAC